MSDEGKNVEGLEQALALEQEKVSVLLDEVIGLEDQLVNRLLADFEAVVTEKTKPFWAEQLLSNREHALEALGELATAKRAQSTGKPQPLHNRQALRTGGTPDGKSAGPGDESLAVRIRNRAQELSKAEGIAFSAAFRKAERELAPQG